MIKKLIIPIEENLIVNLLLLVKSIGRYIEYKDKERRFPGKSEAKVTGTAFH